MRSSDEQSRGLRQAVEFYLASCRGDFTPSARPDLVQPLIDLFHTARDTRVRSACVGALTELAEDGSTPAPLYDALSDQDAGVILSLMGIFALHCFPDAARAWSRCADSSSQK